MKQPKARILIVEDDPAILKGLQDVLLFNGFYAEGITDGLKGLTAIIEGQYDLILLDVMLPGMDGLSICRQVRKKKPGQSVIMITAKGSEDDIVNGFKAGADDYVPKPFSLRELMVRVEAVLRRSGKHLGDEQIRCGSMVFDGLNLQAECQGEIQELTRREMDLIVYLYRHQDRIVSKKELLGNVWALRGRRYRNPYGRHSYAQAAQKAKRPRSKFLHDPAPYVVKGTAGKRHRGQPSEVRPPEGIIV